MPLLGSTMRRVGNRSFLSTVAVRNQAPARSTASSPKFPASRHLWAPRLHITPFSRRPRYIQNLKAQGWAPKDDSMIEIERKFKPTPESIALLRSNSGTPPFHEHKYLGTKWIHDTYYDVDGVLMDLGLYIRWRRESEEKEGVTDPGKGKWEAKVRREGDYLNTHCDEYTGYLAVDGIVVETLRRVRNSEKYALRGLAQLTNVAEYTTKREEWQVGNAQRGEEDKHISIVVDEVQEFPSMVGEVEICRLAPKNEKERKLWARSMDDDIANLVDAYPWAFPPPPNGEKVVGKLSAYFALKKRQEEKKQKFEAAWNQQFEAASAWEKEHNEKK